jgi:hypothetical protein
LTQNVFAAADFKLNFVYALARWGGSAHDQRVFGAAKDKRENPFEVPLGCYYVADAGYTNTEITLMPYRGVRYHLKEHERAELRPADEKELFSLRHASLRNAVERTFGVFKARFRTSTHHVQTLQ